ncbi:MAG: RHS repeat-associated core domain-containing protein [Caldilineaceae bacterium]
MYYYGARWYDPALGRFVQPDTIVPDPGEAKAFDRYAYVLNNPLRYVDPTGHYSRDEIIQHFGCEANDWACVEQQFDQNNVDSPYRGKGDWLQILTDAVDGDPIAATNPQYAATMQGKFLRNAKTGKIEIQMVQPDGQLTGPISELAFVQYGAGSHRYSLESSKYDTHVGQLYHLSPIECRNLGLCCGRL